MTCGLIDDSGKKVEFEERYAQCYFTPQADYQNASNFQEARNFTLTLLKDGLSFIELLKVDPRFEDLRWIISPTNPRMAKLLMRKFRFNQIKNKLSEIFPNSIYVAIQRDDLVSQQASIEDLLTRFKSATDSLL